ncbi:hypothetical protein JK159_09320 [Weissella minor]|uniref:hypothetical protein n=1 Tax=Weissella minor TaxID=1620 RepID=UPI001BB0C31A|nr:hypothetical protein [Weissella minor]MBS0950546.1 hypothetical protein [Weissella minor]
MANQWDWKAELAKAHLGQTELGKIIGLDKSGMSGLVKKMIVGEGKTATDLDKKRWHEALDYINYRQEQFKKEA